MFCNFYTSFEYKKKQSFTAYLKRNLKSSGVYPQTISSEG